MELFMDEPSKARRNLMVFATAVIVIGLLDAKTLSFSGAVLQLGANATRAWLLSIIALIYLCVRFWVSDASIQSRNTAKDNALVVRDQIMRELFIKDPRAVINNKSRYKSETHRWSRDNINHADEIRISWSKSDLSLFDQTQTNLVEFLAFKLGSPTHKYYIDVLGDEDSVRPADGPHGIIQYRVTLKGMTICFLWLSALIQSPKIKWDLLENSVPMIIGILAIASAAWKIMM
jgi:hypothetical protein